MRKQDKPRSGGVKVIPPKDRKKDKEVKEDADK